MDANKNSKKIIILGMILLIIAGIIVVALKGFNVTLMFGKHEAIELKLGKEINMNTVREICDEVFIDKKYVAKELEVFGDSFQVNVESITDDEKSNLISKVNEKFDTEKTVDDLNINSVSNKRIRDVVNPYILPMVITFAIVFVYELIRFRKINAVKLVIGQICKIILTEASLLSCIAIVRAPVDDLIINLLIVIPIIAVIMFLYDAEKKLGKTIEE